VSKESHAEKLGICIGDIIERFNGERVCTTVEVGAYINKFQIKWNEIIYLYCTHALDFCILFFQLENMLLGRCKDHFDQGKKLNAKIDVSVSYF
jgi:hypothetical protein